MTQKNELSEPVLKFITQWVDTVQKNPNVILGEWLYAFGSMSALALKSHEMSKEQLKDAVRFMNDSLAHVYDMVGTTNPTKQ